MTCPFLSKMSTMVMAASSSSSSSSFPLPPPASLAAARSCCSRTPSYCRIPQHHQNDDYSYSHCQQENELSSPSSPLLAVDNRLKKCKSVRQIKQIHAILLKFNENSSCLPVYQLICSTIISFFRQQKHHNESLGFYACSLVKQSGRPDTRAINAIIRGLSTCCKSSNPTTTTNDANCLIPIFDLYRYMLLKGLFPDTYTLPYVLKACSDARALEEGIQLHAHSIKTGLISNIYVSNTLMRVYAVRGLLQLVRKLFDGSPHRDLVSWTTLLQAYLNAGFAKDAIETFFCMCHTGLRPDEKTLVVVLSASAKLGDLQLGEKIHEYMIHHKMNINSDVFLCNGLVDMYLKCGAADLARQVFDEMPVRNVVSWNSMISGLAQQGQYVEALDVFRDMQNTGLKPDDVTLVGVLNSCANLGALELGKWVHAFIDKNRIGADGFIGNALVDMYAKCGSVDQALGVFRAMRCRDIYSYTAMIVGLAMNGEAERALNIFSEMSGMGIRPDEVTFVGVLSACSHAGLVDEGWKHFDDMLSVYNLEPQSEHYGCMVDLLGRAGLVHEAEEFVKNMPIIPDAFVLGALLGACKIHSQVELGENVIRKLVKMEPTRDGAYILMSNIYSHANRWRDASRWRLAMKKRNMKKTPGCSLIEVDGMVYEFYKGDKSHRKGKELYKLLQDMMVHLRNYTTFNTLLR